MSTNVKHCAAEEAVVYLQLTLICDTRVRGASTPHRCTRPLARKEKFWETTSPRPCQPADCTPPPPSPPVPIHCVQFASMAMAWHLRCDVHQPATRRQANIHLVNVMFVARLGSVYASNLYFVSQHLFIVGNKYLKYWNQNYPLKVSETLKMKQCFNASVLKSRSKFL